MKKDTFLMVAGLIIALILAVVGLFGFGLLVGEPTAETHLAKLIAIKALGVAMIAASAYGFKKLF